MARGSMVAMLGAMLILVGVFNWAYRVKLGLFDTTFFWVTVFLGIFGIFFMLIGQAMEV